jgi:hypothetical protein
MKQPQTLGPYSRVHHAYACDGLFAHFTTQIGLTECCQPSKAKGFLRLSNQERLFIFK